jgi:hypothetical protein
MPMPVIIGGIPLPFIIGGGGAWPGYLSRRQHTHAQT